MIKILSKKSTFSSHHLTIEEYQLESKSGKKIVNHVAHRLPTVSIFPLTENNEIYLIHQYRFMYERTMLEAVAGYMEKGEKPLETAKRELHEETGISAAQWVRLPSFELAASVIQATCHLYVAKGLDLGEAELEDDEEIRLVKMPFEEAVEKILSGEIDTSASMLGILLIDKMQREGKI